MAHYMMRWMWKDAAIRAMTETPQDREAAARQVVEAFGGKMSHYFFILGEYDGLLIAEFPDNESAAAVSMRVSASGAFSRFETHALMTAQEAQQSMQRVKSASAAYRAPTG